MSTLDDQLALSSPPVPPQSPVLEAELLHVITQAEGLASPRRRRRGRNVALGGLVLLGAVGAGGAAAAAGLVPWFESAPAHSGLTTSTGTRCTLTWGVKAIEDPAAAVGDDVRARAKAAAERYLSGADLPTATTAEGTHPGSPRATGTETGPAMTVDQREVDAVYREVDRRVVAELTRLHLPPTAVSLSMASTCDGDHR